MKIQWNNLIDSSVQCSQKSFAFNCLMIDDDQMIQAKEHKYKYLHNNGLSLLWGRLYTSLIKTILFQYLFLETWTEILIVSAYYFITSSFVRSKIVQEINSKAKKCKNRDEKKFRKNIPPPLPKKNLFETNLSCYLIYFSFRMTVK